MKAEFRISEQQLAEIRGELGMTDEAEPTFTVEVRDDSGKVVAQVEKSSPGEEKDKLSRQRFHQTRLENLLLFKYLISSIALVLDD